MKRNTMMYLDVELVARARGAVSALDVEGGLSGLVSRLLQSEVERLEAAHGGPFPPVDQLPRGERPGGRSPRL